MGFWTERRPVDGRPAGLPDPCVDGPLGTGALSVDDPSVTGAEAAVEAPVAPRAALRSAQASCGTAAPTGVRSGVNTVLSALFPLGVPAVLAAAGRRRPHSSQ